MAKPIDQLSTNDKLFAMEYCSNGFNMFLAYKAVHKKAVASTISSRASIIAKKPEVRAFIRSYLKEILDRYKDSLHYQIIDIYRLRAFYNPLEIIDSSGELIKPLEELGELAKVVEGIERRPTKEGTVTKVILSNREKSLEMLTKYMNLITEQLELTLKPNKTTLEELNDELNDINSQLREDKGQKVKKVQKVRKGKKEQKGKKG